jgi:hypothetical protein
MHSVGHLFMKPIALLAVVPALVAQSLTPLAT